MNDSSVNKLAEKLCNQLQYITGTMEEAVTLIASLEFNCNALVNELREVRKENQELRKTIEEMQ